MAYDIAVQHVMATPGGTITFNDGSADQYYLNSVPGLLNTKARVVVDKIAFGDGAIYHPPYKDARYFQPTGSLLIQSTRNQGEIQEIRNTMAATLTDAVDSLLDGNGTWTYTPRGGSSRSITIRRDTEGVDWQHVDNYLVLDFVFFLVAPAPDWS